MKARQLNLTIYGQLYKRIELENTNVCWYCGMERQCLDHCPPIGLVPLLNIEKFRSDGYKFLLIPSCNLCNSLLGGEHLYTPNERLCWLLEKYTDLQQKCCYKWTKEQVKELGYSLQLSVTSNLQKHQLYKNKVDGIYKQILESENYKNTAIFNVPSKKAVLKKVKPPTKKQIQRTQSIEREKLRAEQAKEIYLNRLRKIREECWGE